MREPRSRFADIPGGGRIHLADWGGTGTPLLLLHGLSAHTHWFDEVAPLLVSDRPGEHGHCVAAMDLRGHGDSEPPEPPAYCMDGYVADLGLALDALGWERTVLVGHSLGARVCLAFARRRPERVERLAVLDFLGETREREQRTFERRTPRPRRQPTYSDAEIMVRNFHLQPAGTTLGRASLERLARQGIKRLPNGRWTWKFDWRAFNFEYTPIWPRLAEVRVPCLVMRGERSVVMPREVFERVLRTLPDAAGAEIPRAHHHITLDAPGTVAERLLDFTRSA